VGEFLLGSSPIQHAPAALVLLLPLYGGGALLIREVTRRLGRGYPTIVLLGAAYGVIEAGLLDQSMFNPAFLEPDNGTLGAPSLVLSANNALGYVAGHAIWSITVPIAVVELLTRDRDTTPWLGRLGLATTALLYAVGGVIVFSFIYAEYHFVASPVQLLGAAVAAVALTVAAFVIRGDLETGVKPAGREVKPWIVGAGAFVVSSGFVARPENAVGLVVGPALLLAAWWFVRRLSRASWWSARHRAALVSGAMLTYAWTGFVVTYLLWPDDRIAWFGNGLFALMAVGLIVWMAKRTAGGNGTDAGAAGSSHRGAAGVGCQVPSGREQS
jgi:hypothetical protein